MCVCVCVCVYIYVCVCVCVCVYIYIYIYIYIYVYVCIYTFMDVYVYSKLIEQRVAEHQLAPIMYSEQCQISAPTIPSLTLLKAGMELLKGSPRMKTILQRLKFIHSTRRPPNLQTQPISRYKFSDNHTITLSNHLRKKKHNVETNNRGELIQLEEKRAPFCSETQYGLQQSFCTMCTNIPWL